MMTARQQDTSSRYSVRASSDAQRSKQACAGQLPGRVTTVLENTIASTPLPKETTESSQREVEGMLPAEAVLRGVQNRALVQ